MDALKAAVEKNRADIGDANALFKVRGDGLI